MEKTHTTPRVIADSVNEVLTDIISVVVALRKMHQEKPLDDYVSELRKLEDALDDIRVAAE